MKESTGRPVSGNDYFFNRDKELQILVYTEVVDDVPGCVTEALDVLVHDGYLECATGGYRFPSRLLKD